MSARLSMFHGVVVALLGFMVSHALAAATEGENAQYGFKAGDRIVYRLVIHARLPGEERMRTGYLMYVPKSVDQALGRTTLQYKWDLYHGTTTKDGKTWGGMPRVPAFLTKDAASEELHAPEIVIDPRGQVLSFGGTTEQGQLEYGLGPAWQMMLQLLPPKGQTTWTDTHKVGLCYYTMPKGPGGFYINEKHTVEELPADETVRYTAKPAVDGQLVVSREYELKTTGTGAISSQTAGKGEYCFDGKAGVIKTLHLEFVSTHTQSDGSYTTGCSVDGTLMSEAELGKLASEAAAAKVAEEKAKAEEQKKQAAQQAQEQKRRAAEEAKHADELTQVPEGMETSELVGSERGRMLAKLSRRHLPVIGFRIQTADWKGEKCFRVFEPVFDAKPEETAGQTLVMAREGYAVGAITVNANKGVNAICVTFMKKTDKGLDPKDKYVSPWYGGKKGESQKVLTGNGRFVYGTVARKGLNLDAIGIVTEAPPGDDTDK